MTTRSPRNRRAVLEETATGRPVNPRPAVITRVQVDAVPPRRLDLLPCGAVRLVFRWLVGGEPELHVVGPRTSATYKRCPALRSGVAAELHLAAALPMLSIPLRELVDRAVPIRELWPASLAESTIDAMATAHTDAQRLEALGGAISDRLSRASEIERRVAERTRALLSPAENAALPGRRGRSAGAASLRTRRRDFAAAVGLSPKLYARIARFRRAAALVERCDMPLSMIALDTGYYDQAHLSADFREFAGLSATEFRREQARDRLAGACDGGEGLSAAPPADSGSRGDRESSPSGAL